MQHGRDYYRFAGSRTSAEAEQHAAPTGHGRRRLDTVQARTAQ
jgi:hypothetical protein